MNSRFIIIALIACFIALGSCACTYDWECGNQPYSQCRGGEGDCTETISGMAIDNKYVYYGEKGCRADYYNTNYTVKRFPLGGGPSTTVFSSRFSTRSSNIRDIHAVKGNYLYITISAPGALLVMINLQNTAERPGAGLESNLDSMAFDPSTGVTYTSQTPYPTTYLYRYNGVVGQTQGITRDIIYNLDSRLNAIRPQANSDVLYFINATTLFKGSKSCSNCGYPSQILYNVPDEIDNYIYDFVVVGNGAYFAGKLGFFHYDFATKIVKIIYNATVADSIEIGDNKIYFNAGDKIYMVNKDGTNLARANLNTAGKCGCISGFKGQNCDTCNAPAQVQWFDSVPACVPKGDDGFPIMCHKDWECGNVPFTKCRRINGGEYWGECQCVAGFTGSGCTQCEDATQTLTWVNGKPTCQ